MSFYMTQKSYIEMISKTRKFKSQEFIADNQFDSKRISNDPEIGTEWSALEIWFEKDRIFYLEFIFSSAETTFQVEEVARFWIIHFYTVKKS